ncbi:hypothetical protein SHLI107390_05110 [Shewanella livingstonensis]
MKQKHALDKKYHSMFLLNYFSARESDKPLLTNKMLGFKPI